MHVKTLNLKFETDSCNAWTFKWAHTMGVKSSDTEAGLQKE
jgi:hypothetical protein